MINPEAGGLDEQAYSLAMPQSHGDLVGAEGNAPGSSTLAAFTRSRKLYPGPMNVEQRDLRDQARAERRSGKMLERLVRVGVRTLHDRRLPHSLGQLDHVVVAGSGVYVVNAVAVTTRKPLEWLGGRLCIAGQTLTELADFTIAAAEEIAIAVARAFNPGWAIAVFPIITIVGERFGSHSDDGVELVGVERLPERIMNRESLLDPAEVAVLGDAAAVACPPAE